MTSAGELKDIVTFQCVQRAQDGAGGYAETWRDLAEWPQAWAKVEPVQGGTSLRGMQVDWVGTYGVTIRTRRDLANTMRIVWGELVLQIVDLQPPRQGDAFMRIIARTVDV